MGIELLCNTQALDFQESKSSPAIEAAKALVRKHIRPIEEDRIFYKDMEKLVRLIESREILSVVEEHTGELR